MTESSSAPNVPDHVDKAARSVAQLHSDHRGSATTPQRAVNRITAVMARPWLLVLLLLSAAVWIVANLIASSLGAQPIDEPPHMGCFQSSSLISALHALWRLDPKREPVFAMQP